MAANNIDQRIRYKEGSNKPEKPHKKLNGNINNNCFSGCGWLDL